MEAQLIDGRQIAAVIRAEVAAEVAELRRQGIHPGLGVVLVGDDPASHVYVRMKTRACEAAGIVAHDIRLPGTVSLESLLAELASLNEDPGIHGILVQLPLPEHLDVSSVMEYVRPDKDVDGFHPINIGRLVRGDPTALRPATPAGIQELLKRIGFDPAGRHAVIVGRSNIVGFPMAQILLQKEPWANATVTVAHSRTTDLAAITRQAELLIVAIGRAGVIRGDMIREGAVVIDVGVNRVPDETAEKGYRLVGDVVFEEALERASWITPVPGGVGPMTIAMLLQNTVTAARQQAAAGAALTGTGR